MRSLSDTKIKVTLIHIIFWILLTVLMLLILQRILDEKRLVYIALFINLIGFIILIYIHLKVLLPVFFDRQRFGWYLVSLSTIVLIISAGRFFLGWAWTNQIDSPAANLFTVTYYGSIVVSSVFVLLISIPLRLIESWFKKQALEQVFKTYQLESELRFLKAQVNPHFLFNALNNIYSLSFTASDKAPEMILKLSEMMSYMLYDCKQELVSLQSEINYLQNYIALQQLKKEGEYQIDFQQLGPTTGVQIPPMLFIPFFENVFKHGNLEEMTKAYLISVLKVQDGKIQFSIKNTFEQGRPKALKGGVGLENVKKRLLLLFPKKHKLSIKKLESEFIVHLEIQL